LIASPVLTAISPDDPDELVPLLKIRFPLTPPLPLFLVYTITLPLDTPVLFPDEIVVNPPVLLVSDDPANIEIVAPLSPEAVPPRIFIFPPLFEALPAVTFILPDEPADVDPDLK